MALNLGPILTDQQVKRQRTGKDTIPLSEEFGPFLFIELRSRDGEEVKLMKSQFEPLYGVDTVKSNLMEEELLGLRCPNVIVNIILEYSNSFSDIRIFEYNGISKLLNYPLYAKCKGSVLVAFFNEFPRHTRPPAGHKVCWCLARIQPRPPESGEAKFVTHPTPPRDTKNDLQVTIVTYVEDDFFTAKFFVERDSDLHIENLDEIPKIEGQIGGFNFICINFENEKILAEVRKSIVWGT